MAPVSAPAPATTRQRTEAAAIARAEAALALGRGIEDAALEAWLDALDRDATAPLPSVSPPPMR